MTTVAACGLIVKGEVTRTTEDIFIQQAKSKIHDWKHELFEIEAKAKLGIATAEQLQISAQRIIELKSQIATAEKQIQEAARS